MHVFGINSGFLGIPSSRTDRRLKKSLTFRQKLPTLGKVTFWVLHEHEEHDEFLENLVFPPKGMLKSFSEKTFHLLVSICLIICSHILSVCVLLEGNREHLAGRVFPLCSFCLTFCAG